MIPRMVDVLAARQRIRHHVDITPLRDSDWLTSAIGSPVALKLECVQRTGSFKIRGAFNALVQMDRSPAEAGPSRSAGQSRRRHIVTASAGNHGRAMAVAAETLGMQATVFAPRDAPQAKLAAITRHGADLRLVSSYDEAERAARAFARDTQLPFISAYNHPDVIAGAGTIALELFDAMPTIGTIVVPVGGGGLISGVAVAAKSIAPRIRVIGVEVAASCAMVTSVRAGHITSIEPQPTLADGLAGNLEPSSMTFDIVRQFVDEIETVTERELADALRAFLAEEHLLTEGAGAVAAAALMAGKVRTVGPVAALVTGANVDEGRLMGALGKRPER